MRSGRPHWTGRTCNSACIEDAGIGSGTRRGDGGRIDRCARDRDRRNHTRQIALHNRRQRIQVVRERKRPRAAVSVRQDRIRSTWGARPLNDSVDRRKHGVVHRRSDDLGRWNRHWAVWRRRGRRARGGEGDRCGRGWHLANPSPTSTGKRCSCNRQGCRQC